MFLLGFIAGAIVSAVGLMLWANNIPEEVRTKIDNIVEDWEKQ